MYIRKQVDIYTHLIKDYETRLKELILENGDIKQTITNIAIKLSSLCKNFKNSTLNDIDENMRKNNHDFIKNLPFETISSKLDEYFKTKFYLIEKSIKNNRDEVENLNTTFTIQDDVDENDDSFDSINDSINNKSVNSKLAGGCDVNQSEISCLKNELDEYKHIIKTQNEMISSFNQNLSITNDKSISLIEVEANAIIEERTKLSEEKKLYYKQKLQFEEDKLRYNQAILQLAKQRKQFEEEKQNYHKNKLYESFNNDSNNSSFREPKSSSLSFDKSNKNEKKT